MNIIGILDRILDNRISHFEKHRTNFVIGCAVLAIIGFLSSYYIVSSIIVDYNISNMKELAKHDKQAIKNSIYFRQQEIINLSDALWRHRLLSIQGLHEHLRTTNDQFGMLRINAVSTNGIFYSSNGTSKKNQDYLDIIKDNPNGFVKRYGGTNGVLLFGMPVHPFRVEKEQFNYVLGEILIRDLAEDMEISSYDGQGKSFIVDEKGEFVIAGRANQEDNISAYHESVIVRNPESFQKVLEEREDFSTPVTYNGEEYILVFSPMDYGWNMVSMVPKSVFQSLTNTITILFSALLIIIFIAVGIVVLLILRSKVLVEKSEAEMTHMAELQEKTAQQEAQLEEITALNQQLHENHHQLHHQLDIINAISQIYHCLYYVNIKDNSFIEVGANLSGIRKIIGKSGSASDAYAAMNKYIIVPEHVEAMTEFTDLSTLNERLKDKVWIGREFKGNLSGWSEGIFIVVDRDENGNCIHVLWGTRGVDEVKRKELIYQEQLQEATAKADAANKAKSEFLFSMSHDIRTPMNAIIGFATLLHKHYDDKEKVLEYTEKINSSGEFLLDLINNILDLAKIESGHAVLDIALSDIRNFNKEIYDVFGELMKKKKISFTSQINTELKYIYADDLKLRQIFLNLISNAYKYTPEGGKVDIILDELPSDRPGYCLLQHTISDNGIGISEEYLPHLFEEFSREKNSTESKILGTGLGMPIVKKLIELMDGEISVSSKMGKGTTFKFKMYFRIPSEEEIKAQTGDSADDAEINFAGKRILMAEDYDFNAEIAQEILEDVGFEVERATDGIVCVHMLEQAEPDYYDLILMDIQMPNMDGYKATKIIRQLPDKKKSAIPICAMTANAFEEDKRKSLEVGMNGHLSKPIRIPALMEELARLLK